MLQLDVYLKVGEFIYSACWIRQVGGPRISSELDSTIVELAQTHTTHNFRFLSPPLPTTLRVNAIGTGTGTGTDLAHHDASLSFSLIQTPVE